MCVPLPASYSWGQLETGHGGSFHTTLGIRACPTRTSTPSPERMSAPLFGRNTEPSSSPGSETSAAWGQWGGVFVAGCHLSPRVASGHAALGRWPRGWGL